MKRARLVRVHTAKHILESQIKGEAEVVTLREHRVERMVEITVRSRRVPRHVELLFGCVPVEQRRVAETAPAARSRVAREILTDGRGRREADREPPTEEEQSERTKTQATPPTKAVR